MTLPTSRNGRTTRTTGWWTAASTRTSRTTRSLRPRLTPSSVRWPVTTFAPSQAMPSARVCAATRPTPTCWRQTRSACRRRASPCTRRLPVSGTPATCPSHRLRPTRQTVAWKTAHSWSTPRVASPVIGPPSSGPTPVVVPPTHWHGAATRCSPANLPRFRRVTPTSTLRHRRARRRQLRRRQSLRRRLLPQRQLPPPPRRRRRRPRLRQRRLPPALRDRREPRQTVWRRRGPDRCLRAYRRSRRIHSRRRHRRPWKPIRRIRRLRPAPSRPVLRPPAQARDRPLRSLSRQLRVHRPPPTRVLGSRTRTVVTATVGTPSSARSPFPSWDWVCVFVDAATESDSAQGGGMASSLPPPCRGYYLFVHIYQGANLLHLVQRRLAPWLTHVL